MHAVLEGSNLNVRSATLNQSMHVWRICCIIESSPSRFDHRFSATELSCLLHEVLTKPMNLTNKKEMSRDSKYEQLDVASFKSLGFVLLFYHPSVSLHQFIDFFWNLGIL